MDEPVDTIHAIAGAAGVFRGAGLTHLRPPIGTCQIPNRCPRRKEKKKGTKTCAQCAVRQYRSRKASVASPPQGRSPPRRTHGDAAAAAARKCTTSKGRKEGVPGQALHSAGLPSVGCRKARVVMVSLSELSSY